MMVLWYHFSTMATARIVEKRRLVQVLDFLEKEVWPAVPKKLLGRPVTKKERETILGYGRDGV
jgi:hypothetical protein